MRPTPILKERVWNIEFSTGWACRGLRKERGGGRGKNLKREFAISKIPMSSEIRHRHLALNGMDKVFDLFAKRDELEQPKEYQLPERCP
jgi:hypothetical protein